MRNLSKETDDRVQIIRNTYIKKPTEELLNIWCENDRDILIDETFDIIKKILKERGKQPPPQVRWENVKSLKVEYKKFLKRNRKPRIPMKELNVKIILRMLAQIFIASLKLVIVILFLGILGAGIWVWVAALGYLYLKSIFKIKQQLAIEVNQLRAKDNRTPILLLRSFEEDFGTVEKKPYLKISRIIIDFWPQPIFEHVLIEELWRYGPPVALGRPGEKLPPLGAAREYVVNEDWCQRITNLIEESKLILLIIGNTESVMWEINKIFEMEALNKLIIVFPPCTGQFITDRFYVSVKNKRGIKRSPIADVYEIAQVWKNFSNSVNLSTLNLPPSLPARKTLMIVCNEWDKPHIITADYHTTENYRIAIWRAIQIKIENEHIENLEYEIK